MIRRLAVAAVLAAIFTGCALADSGPSEKRVPDRSDQAWAQRINFTRRDLPGFVQGPPQASTWQPFTCTQFAPDLSRFTITGRANSRAFSNATTVLISVTQIFRTAHDELADWRLSARREALRCYDVMLENATNTGKGKITSSAMLPAPHVGDRAVFYRVGAMTSLGPYGRPEKAWLDVLATARGRARAVLAVWTTQKLLPPAFEQSLLARLARRLSK
jgi:hypothetical protein